MPRDPATASDPATVSRDAAADVARLRALDDAVRSCEACALHAERFHPSVGEGPIGTRLMIVGFVPGQHEDLRGTALAGSARNVIDHAMSQAGIDAASVRITNLVRCRPADDRPPTIAEARVCSSYLRTELDLVAPEVVVALGDATASFLYGRPLVIDQVAGYRLDVAGITLIPTYAPADVLRGRPFASEALRRDMATAQAVLDGRLPSGAQLLEEVRAHLADGRLPAGMDARTGP